MNYLILLLTLNNSVSIILYSNILLNVVQLALLFKVTEKIFGRKEATVAAVIYMLYLNNVGLVLLNLTELPFGLFVLVSIYFFISKKAFKNYLLCGVACGLAIGIRPTAWALVLSFFIVSITQLFQGKEKPAQFVLILVGILLYIIPMGLIAKRNIGRFEFTSTTGPANIIMSANPRAKGVFDPYFFYNDSIYLTKKTYVERNEYLITRSKEYIIEHPWKWLSLIPRKIYSTFISDGWGVPQLLNSQKWDINVYLKGKGQTRQEFQEETFLFRTAFWTLNIWQQLIYGFIAFFFLVQLYVFIKGRNFSSERLMINLFIIIGTGLTVASSVGNPRYKYNFLIVAIIVVSPVVAGLLRKFENVKKLE
jgi:4-amino-4-deoxy-L-arabinose transferase-like glycosyltransferase